MPRARVRQLLFPRAASRRGWAGEAGGSDSAHRGQGFYIGARPIEGTGCCSAGSASLVGTGPIVRAVTAKTRVLACARAIARSCRRSRCDEPFVTEEARGRVQRAGRKIRDRNSRRDRENPGGGSFRAQASEDAEYNSDPLIIIDYQAKMALIITIT